MAEPICPHCNQPNLPGSLFCDNCGARLPEVGAAPTPLAAPAAAAPVSGTPCPTCGTYNLERATFCEGCGSALTAQAMPSEPPTGPPPPPTRSGTIIGRLEVIGSGGRISFPPGKTELIMGREDPVSGIFPDIDLEPHGGHEAGVGRRHARLVLRDERLYLEDLNSINGTALNRVKLAPSEPAVVHTGDEIRLGKLVLLYFEL